MTEEHAINIEVYLKTMEVQWNRPAETWNRTALKMAIKEYSEKYHQHKTQKALEGMEEETESFFRERHTEMIKFPNGVLDVHKMFTMNEKLKSSLFSAKWTIEEIKKRLEQLPQNPKQ
jgi:hypothetical protein